MNLPLFLNVSSYNSVLISCHCLASPDSKDQVGYYSKDEGGYYSKDEVGYYNKDEVGYYSKDEVGYWPFLLCTKLWT